MSYADYEYVALRRRVEKLERLMALLIEQLGLECDEKPGPDMSPMLKDLVREGELVEAIKLYREETGAGLKEAKPAFDAHFGIKQHDTELRTRGDCTLTIEPQVRA